MNELDKTMLDAILDNDEKRQALIDLLDDNPHAIEDILNDEEEAVDFTVKGRLTPEEVKLVGKIAASEELMADILDQACEITVERDRSRGVKI